MITLKAQTKWSWLIAAYLFLAGVGGGAYITGVAADFVGGEEWAGIARIGVFLGFPLVLIGCMFLLADLGKPQNFWRAWMKPGTSWIARGTLIITIFMILAFLHTVFWIWPFNSLEAAVGARHLIGVAGVVFAFATVIYTGILLGAARPIAFWSTAMLPLVFLVSALSTGLMAVILVGSVAEGATPLLTALEKADSIAIVLELFVLGFYLQGTHRVRESRASAQVVLTGSVAPLFWLGVVVLGLLAPLGFELVGIFGAEGSGAAVTAFLGALCGILGGLFLRRVVLAGGIHAPLEAGRFEYALTNV
jgi:polysulfide reductase chain C